ncbi:hypothetical protein GCM10011487_44690 [Steroidobacter agaridevorans]|uniref:Uncharacterized protein n=2 Tax=Steroidobacter agaridevorans TaxID=2695856 RepID=A0A829YGU9_9GAMM|nr:hypothetical protein GCM10011487_44690 [Steroidobacter agaridevorans]
MIVARLRDINACISRVRAGGAERCETLTEIHHGLVGVATSLEWQVKRHYPSECSGSIPPQNRDRTIREKTMCFVGEGMQQCRATVLQAASRLEPFVGSGEGQRDKEALLKAELPQSVSDLHVSRSSLLEDALIYSVLRLAGAATRLIDLEKKLS